MSVIGYLIRCDACNLRMLVTVEAKDQRMCPDCLDDYIYAAIEQAVADDDGSDGNDDDYPLGEVTG